MNNARIPVTTLTPPIARPKKRSSMAHVSASTALSTPRNPHVLIQSPSLHNKHAHNPPSGRSVLNQKEPLPNVNSSDDFFGKKGRLRKIGHSSSERRRFSIDLSDVLKPPNTDHKVKKIQHSSSLLYRQSRYSMDEFSICDSPLSFNNEESNEEDDGQVVVVTVHSNWGSRDFLRVSSISILDEKFMTVPVIKSTTSPDIGIDTKSLFEGHLIKNEMNELFSIPWNENHEPVSIAIMVSKEVTISGVRVFNSEISLDSSVKDISISLDHANTLSGEIPKNFGIDFKFTKKMREDAVESSRLIDNYFNENREKAFEDKYGVYPLFSTKTLSFEILNTWNDEDFIGINGFQIFDQYNKLIQMDDIDDIIVHNCGKTNNPSLLFKDDLKTSRPERQFLTKRLNDLAPLIEVIFKKNTFLSKLVIWNYNSSREPVEYGIKNIKIRSDETVIWCGRILKSIGNEISADKKLRTIWLTDSSEIKNQEVNDI